MSQFLLESLRRYKERVRADRRFQTDLTRVRRLAEHSRIASDEFFLCLLTPLIEVSWVDGSIGRYEQDAILRAGDRYGLFTKDENFYVLMERLSARPTAGEYGALWSEIFERLRTVRLPATAAIASHLLEQTKYVAGLGQKQVVGFWRGHQAGPDELEALRSTEQRLGDLEINSSYSGTGGSSDDLLKLVPHVNVAWADGRITKRERRLIFDSFFELGIKPTDDNIQHLLSWLKLTPSSDFMQRAFQRLRERFESLPADESANEKYSLISHCTLVAEASGGTSDYVAGGARICDEEIVAVKRIAAILNGAMYREHVDPSKGGNE